MNVKTTTNHLKLAGFVALVFNLICCSTLSQNSESPIVVKPKGWSIGAGAGYLHDYDLNESLEDRSKDFAPTGFVGGRYSFLQNSEVSVSGASLGLTLGSAVEGRLRWTWLGGWKSESQIEKIKRKKQLKKMGKSSAKLRASKKLLKLERDNELDEEDLDGFEESYILTDGWMSTVSVGALWAGYSDIQDYSVSSNSTGFFISNSVGYKSKKWTYYFGVKALQANFTYNFKEDRTEASFDIEGDNSRWLFGGFLGTSYLWSGRKDHAYQWDILISFMPLPSSAGSEEVKVFPGITTTFWFLN